MKSQSLLNFLAPVLTLIFVGQWTMAGTKDSGGGVGFLCKENGVERVYLADTYHSMHKNPSLQKIEVDEKMVFLSAARLFEQIRSEKFTEVPLVKSKALQLGWFLIYQNVELKYQPVPHLDLLGDDNIPASAVPKNCVKVQLAVQNLLTGIVEVNQALLAKMSAIENTFLKLHETVIALRNRPGEDTSPVRNYIAAVLDTPDFSFADFLKTLQNPDWLPKKKYSESELAVIADLPGHYIGKDPVARDCTVDIEEKNGALKFKIQVETYKPLEMGPIGIGELAAKLAADIEFKKENSPDATDYMFLIYPSQEGVPSFFGTYPFNSDLSIGWHRISAKTGWYLSSVAGEKSASVGPFIPPGSRERADCFIRPKVTF